MAFKYDKPYRNLINIDNTKNIEIINLSNEMNSQEIVQYMLINKISLSIASDSNNNNLIHYTLNNSNSQKTEFNKLNFIKFLVQNNVNPDQPNKNNETPLHIACQRQYYTIVEYLLKECSVNSNYKDNNGLTPLHWLLSGNIKIYEQKEIRDLILTKKEDSEPKKEDILKIKRAIFELIEKNPFFESLENSILYFLSNNEQVKNVIFETKIRIGAILSNSSPASIKENTELVESKKNRIEEIGKQMWKSFSKSDDIVIHTTEKDSFPNNTKNNISIIKNSNYKNQLKKNIIEESNNFSQYIDSIFNNKNKYDLNNLINEYITDIASNFFTNNNLESIPSSRNMFRYNNNTFTIEDNTLWNKLHTENKIPEALDFADNIIDIDKLSFIGGSRDVTINFSLITNEQYKRDILEILNYFKGKEDNTELFKKLFKFLIDLDHNPNITRFIPSLLTPRLGRTIESSLNNQPEINKNITAFINKYKDQLNNPSIILQLYNDYLKLKCINSKDQLTCTIHTLFVKFIATLMNKDYSYIGFKKTLLFEYVLLIKNTYNDTIILLILFLYIISNDETKIDNLVPDINNLVKNLNNTNYDLVSLMNKLGLLIKPNMKDETTLIQNISVALIYISNDKTVPDKIITELTKNPNISLKQNIINSIYQIYEKLDNKVPLIILTDFFYLIEDFSLLSLFQSNDITKISNIIDAKINTVIKKTFNNQSSNNYKTLSFLSLLLPPSYQGYLFCLMDSRDLNHTIIKNKFYEAKSLCLYYNGILPELQKNMTSDFDLRMKQNRILFIPNKNNMNNLLPFPFNYYFKKLPTDINLKDIQNNINGLTTSISKLKSADSFITTDITSANNIITNINTITTNTNDIIKYVNSVATNINNITTTRDLIQLNIINQNILRDVREVNTIIIRNNPNYTNIQNDFRVVDRTTKFYANLLSTINSTNTLIIDTANTLVTVANAANTITKYVNNTGGGLVRSINSNSIVIGVAVAIAAVNTGNNITSDIIIKTIADTPNNIINTDIINIIIAGVRVINSLTDIPSKIRNKIIAAVTAATLVVSIDNNTNNINIVTSVLETIIVNNIINWIISKIPGAPTIWSLWNVGNWLNIPNLINEIKKFALDIAIIADAADTYRLNVAAMNVAANAAAATAAAIAGVGRAAAAAAVPPAAAARSLTAIMDADNLNAANINVANTTAALNIATLISNITRHISDELNGASGAANAANVPNVTNDTIIKAMVASIPISSAINNRVPPVNIIPLNTAITNALAVTPSAIIATTLAEIITTKTTELNMRPNIIAATIAATSVDNTDINNAATIGSLLGEWPSNITIITDAIKTVDISSITNNTANQVPLLSDILAKIVLKLPITIDYFVSTGPNNNNRIDVTNANISINSNITNINNINNVVIQLNNDLSNNIMKVNTNLQKIITDTQKTITDITNIMTSDVNEMKIIVNEAFQITITASNIADIIGTSIVDIVATLEDDTMRSTVDEITNSSNRVKTFSNDNENEINRIETSIDEIVNNKINIGNTINLTPYNDAVNITKNAIDNVRSAMYYMDDAFTKYTSISKNFKDVYTTTTTDITEYYKYVAGKYRPPYKKSLENMKINYSKILYDLLEIIVKDDTYSYSTFLKNLKEQKKLKDITKQYFDYYKIIYQINNYEQIINSDNLMFDINKFNNYLNKINGIIYLYYYLSNKNSIKIPKFLYYKLGAPKYYLFNNTKKDLILPNSDSLSGGAISVIPNNNGVINMELSTNNDNIINFIKSLGLNNFIVNTSDYETINTNTLPPSMEDILDLYYDYNKIKVIIDTLALDAPIQSINTSIETLINKHQLSIDKNDKDTYIKLLFAQYIEELLKDQAFFYIKKATTKLFTDPLDTVPNNEIDKLTGFQDVIFKNTKINFTDSVKDEFFTNNYLFLNKNVKKECDFILYPNEYSTNNILKQKYCLTINQKIIELLIIYNANPFELDTDLNSILNPIMKTYHYQSIQTLNNLAIKYKDYNLPKDPINILKSESLNHIAKLFIPNSYIKTINSFVGIQATEINNIILSNENFGNNIINYINESFSMAFYLINEYITDYLWKFDTKYKNDDMTKIFKITNSDITHITQNYLQTFLNTIKIRIPSTNEYILMQDYINKLKQDNKKLNNKMDLIKLEITENGSRPNIVTKLSSKKIKLDDILDKNKTVINSLNSKVDNNKIANIQNKEKGNKIIESYGKIFNIDNGPYIKIWSELFKNKDELEKSWNLSLLHILAIEKELLSKPFEKNEEDMKTYTLLNTYYKHIQNISTEYFEGSKYIETNKILNYIYDILIHLTKTIICFNIEMILRNYLLKYFFEQSSNSDDKTRLSDSIDKINFIFSQNIKEYLYNTIPEKFVKNSVKIFKNFDEQIIFEEQSIKEILKDLFDLLTIGDVISIPKESTLMTILNKDLANYFDIFIEKLILNWYVVIENTLKFVINQYRINNTLYELIK